MTTLAELRAEVYSSIDRDREGIDLDAEAARYSGSLREFIPAAWPHAAMPRKFVSTWHVDSIAEHYQAAMEREITRLLITIQPGGLKSSIFSVFGPAWWWTRKPAERILSSSYKDRLAERDTRYSRNLMQTRWFRSHWNEWDFSGDENLKTRYSNTAGGHRIALHVGGGTGERGGVLQLDDPHNAQDARSQEKVKLEAAVEWWSNTWASRLDDLEGDPGVMLVIGQRIDETDLIGHLLEIGGWHHLCLPTEYEVSHPLIVGGSYPATVELPSGKVIKGDPRDEVGELLMPKVQTPSMLAAKRKSDGVTAHVYAGQYQQRPAPREGKLLKRADWLYYDPELSFYRRASEFGPKQVAELTSRFGEFDYIGHFWDTSVKDTEHSDYASGGVWGVVGSMRYLLRLYHERAALNATIEGMRELSVWAHSLWGDLGHFIVVENSANGPDAVKRLRKSVTGLTLSNAVGTKWTRASAAEPALVGHNCVLPGWPNEAGESYDETTPMDVQEFVEELAAFNSGSHDDQVDMWSSMVNWTEGRMGGAEMSVPEGQVQPERFLHPGPAIDPRATRVRPAIRS